MQRRLALVIAALLAVGLVQLSPLARAATPSSGSLRNPGDRVAWSGGPFVASNPVTPTPGVPFCQSGEPGCDHYTVNVSTTVPATLVIDVHPANATDDYDLYVYGPSGKLEGQSATNPTDAGT